MDFDQPIHTHEQARAYYVAMNCNGFHMCRGYPQRYEEFRKLRISESTLRRWRHEHVEAGLASLVEDETQPENLWCLHDQLAEIVCSLTSHQLLRKFYDATVLIQPRLSQFDKLLVAETLVGRSAIQNKSGLLFRCHLMFRQQLAQQYAELVRKLVSEPFDETERNLLSGEPIETRRLDLLALLESVLKGCEKRFWRQPWAFISRYIFK